MTGPTPKVLPGSFPHLLGGNARYQKMGGMSIIYRTAELHLLAFWGPYCIYKGRDRFFRFKIDVATGT